MPARSFSYPPSTGRVTGGKQYSESTLFDTYTPTPSIIPSKCVHSRSQGALSFSKSAVTLVLVKASKYEFSAQAPALNSNNRSARPHARRSGGSHYVRRRFAAACQLKGRNPSVETAAVCTWTSLVLGDLQRGELEAACVQSVWPVSLATPRLQRGMPAGAAPDLRGQRRTTTRNPPLELHQATHTCVTSHSFYSDRVRLRNYSRDQRDRVVPSRHFHTGEPQRHPQRIRHRSRGCLPPADSAPAALASRRGMWAQMRCARIQSGDRAFSQWITRTSTS